MAYPYTPPPTSSPKSESKFGVSTQDNYFYSPPNLPPSHQRVVAIHQQSLQGAPLPSPRTPSPGTTLQPRRTPSPGGRKTPQNPIYYSPTNPVPSPYSASRPKPRPGFRKRVLDKISGFIRKIYLWAQENPIKAGLVTFVPVLGLVGATKMLRGIGKLFGKGKNVLDRAVKESRTGAEKARKGKKEGKKPWGWGLDHFVDFNGSKGGPLDGVLKVLQMWVNHICRVSPSMIPRTMSIFLELYFLELEMPF